MRRKGKKGGTFLSEIGGRKASGSDEKREKLAENQPHQCLLRPELLQPESHRPGPLSVSLSLHIYQLMGDDELTQPNGVIPKEEQLKTRNLRNHMLQLDQTRPDQARSIVSGMRSETGE